MVQCLRFPPTKSIKVHHFDRVQLELVKADDSGSEDQGAPQFFRYGLTMD